MWRTYIIFSDSNVFDTHSFYAPTLDVAFASARVRWPGAKTWTCLGDKC